MRSGDDHGPWRERILTWVVPAIVISFPLWRLWPLHGQFYIDWYNHKWLAAYSGELLRHHATVPVVVNTAEQAGMAYPIFYGTLFYPVLSVLTTWMDPGVVIRIVAVVVTWLQFRLVSRALAASDVPRWFATGVACLVIWAIYPLTNLYNRSAITEYVATALLTGTGACWFLLVHARDPGERRRLGLGCGLMFVLAAGTHPITALYSLPILALLVVAAYCEHGRDRAFWRALFRALIAPVALAVVVLAPWIYALGSFNHALQIHSSTDTVGYNLPDIDRWTTRFCPIPFDRRLFHLKPAAVSTPYLDSQINVALLVLLVGCVAVFAWRNRTAAVAGVRSVATALIAFAFFTWLSLSPSSFDLMPAFARMVQIAYRLVTYENLSILLAVFSFVGFMRRRGDQSLFAGKVMPVVLSGCVALAAAGVVIKWRHASAIMHLEGSPRITTLASERRSWATMPERFAGSAPAYSTPSLYQALSAAERETLREARIPIGTGDAFGVPQLATVHLDRDAWLGTNVQAFPWNHLVLDGREIPDAELRVAGSAPPSAGAAGPPAVDAFDLVVHAPAGDHTLGFVTTPDASWLILRAVSFAALALWAAWLTYSTARRSARAA